MAFTKGEDGQRVKIDASKIPTMPFNKVKVGGKTLRDDVTITPEFFSLPDSRKYKKKDIEKALLRGDLNLLRAVSRYYYEKSGIYKRLCKYLAHFYRYDFFVTPVQYDKKVPQNKVIDGWYRACLYLENSDLKRVFNQIALKVVKDGAFYGYTLRQSDMATLQELPIRYCRSRYSWNNNPAVEFNVKYFDDQFADSEYRIKVIKMFPKEVQKAYIDYKKGVLPRDYHGDTAGWVLLDPTLAVKFSLDSSDCPVLASVIPHLMDLEDAQDLDKQKMIQQILRVIVQQFPLDKSYDLVFDLDEMNAFHRNAVEMLGDAVGVDVLSTLADVKVLDMSDKSNVSSVDQLEKVERTVYNESGMSQALFNSEGSVALEKSVANDEASITDLLLQFEDYAEKLIAPLNKMIKKKLIYRVNMLPTTVYNYKDLSSIYKEQTMLGFSKLLPQVALGLPQTVVIASAVFENQMLKLDDVFTPPQMSSTISNKDKEEEEEDKDKTGTAIDTVPTDDKGGRPELGLEEKSEKTVRNIEAEQ